jgi:hypothetical protein
VPRRRDERSFQRLRQHRERAGRGPGPGSTTTSNDTWPACFAAAPAPRRPDPVRKPSCSSVVRRRRPHAFESLFATPASRRLRGAESAVFPGSRSASLFAGTRRRIACDAPGTVRRRTPPLAEPAVGSNRFSASRFAASTPELGRGSCQPLRGARARLPQPAMAVYRAGAEPVTAGAASSKEALPDTFTHGAFRPEAMPVETRTTRSTVAATTGSTDIEPCAAGKAVLEGRHAARRPVGGVSNWRNASRPFAELRLPEPALFEPIPAKVATPERRPGAVSGQDGRRCRGGSTRRNRHSTVGRVRTSGRALPAPAGGVIEYGPLAGPPDTTVSSASPSPSTWRASRPMHGGDFGGRRTGTQL